MKGYAWVAVLCWIACAGPPAHETLPDEGANTTVPTVSAPVDTLRVLFIGNSYTYVNDLPRLVQRLAASASDAPPMAVAMVTRGGATLEEHWSSGAARQRIAEGGWDYVVLQEQSLRPLRDREKLFEYARLFDAAIKEAGAKTVFYLTWARENRPDTQAALTQAFLDLAEELDALAAPAGVAWEAARRAQPEIALYVEDGSHPSPTGTYLAACVFYAIFVGESPEGLAAVLFSTRFGTPQEGSAEEIEPLPEADAAMLQRIAWEAVGHAESVSSGQ